MSQFEQCNSCGERDAIGFEQGENGVLVKCFSCGNVSETKPTRDEAVKDWNERNET